MKKNDNTTAEKPAKKLTAEQKAKAKEKLAKKRAALKEKKRLAREKKAARLAKKRAAKKAVREAKKAKKLARIEKKRARILKARELKRARLEKKRAKLAAKKAKAKELKAKQKAKQKDKAVKTPKTVIEIEKANLDNIATKDMVKTLTKRLKTFVKVLTNDKAPAADREDLAKLIAKDGIQVSVLDGVLVARLFISAEARVAEPKQPAVKCTAIAAEQPKENAQPEAAAKEPPVEAEATEVPIGDTYGSEPTDEELAQIEAEQDAEAADGDEAEDDEEEEEIDPRSDVDDDQADFRREFFGAAENTEDFE